MMLKKVQKVPQHPHSQTLPPPPPRKDVPTVTATHASPPSKRSGRERRRSVSSLRTPEGAKLQSNRLRPKHASPASRGRSSSAQPSRDRQPSADVPRIVPNPVHVRSNSKTSSDGSTSPPHNGEKKLRKSWLHGRSRSNSGGFEAGIGTGAWIMSPDNLADYNTAALVDGEKVPELWNQPGNVCVYLHPKPSGLGPSFRVADHVVGSSLILSELLTSEGFSPNSRPGHLLTPDDATRPQWLPPSSMRASSGKACLYLPLANTDVESLVAARNLFAFLTSQPLVGTTGNPTVFAALLNISSLLRQFGFSSYDGSSFGEDVDAAFDLFIDQFGIGDVRASRTKTIEALVLAEQMKSWNLYNEAFAHAVGKYDDLRSLNSPLFRSISLSTRNRLERAHLDLINRESNVHLRLETFEFPSLFAGVASSTSREEYRNVKFKEWRNSFAKMRNFVLGYYKDKFGNWPPKAKSKKNHFSRSGLNRLCLKMLYSDLCALYDLLVDRESMTPRAIDQLFEDADGANPSITALRKMLSEFDHSSPPVLPPIPYDIPKLPSMTAIHGNYNQWSAKKQAKLDKTLQSNELLLLFIKSHNIDTDSLQTPFLNAFKEFELKEAKSVHPQDMADQRIGYWLFLHAVIQSLPMLVVDAPGLNYTEGVEYFLCQAPQGNAPWIEDAGEVRKMWYQTAGQGIVELSADVIMFSVEGIYMRSHCWLAAKEWQEQRLVTPSQSGPALASGLVTGSGSFNGPPPPPIREIGPSPLEPPRAVFQDLDPMSNPLLGPGGSPVGSAPGSPLLMPRNTSPTGMRRGHRYHSSMSMGLEPLSFPELGGVPGDRGSRIVSVGGSRPGSSNSGIPPIYQLGQRSVSVTNLRPEHGPPRRASPPGQGHAPSPLQSASAI
ncbi:hypothetical protein B0H67DRAFT_597474 [Lasiosphaeris hirsuta]|uniref:DUF8004 domain-containing protein n=1 Tax=Lasiosphaeris hirsuta TaxID=260670 RepID=A0AA40BCH8_9PEZI|nr:hypothetical protein B0H67DRAFT_597474 [Lasiosphaeris hirsuta]